MSFREAKGYLSELDETLRDKERRRYENVLDEMGDAIHIPAKGFTIFQGAAFCVYLQSDSETSF